MIAEAIKHLSKDKKLNSIISTIELDYHWKPEEQGDVYVHLMRSIIAQQVSVQSAAAIQKRFLSLFEDNYPHPEQLMQYNLEDLRAVSLSRQKAQYVQNVAHFFTTESLFKEDWTKWEDEAILRRLTEIKGIGEWTVQMILMFCLNRGNVLPVKDLAIQNTMKRLYGLEETGRALTSKMKEIGAAWSPYQTLACYYLWSWKHRW